MVRLAFLVALSTALLPAQTAHINSISGNVTVLTAGGAAVAAAPDTLVISDTTIITPAHATAGIDFDWANTMELNPKAELRLTKLAPAAYQAEIVRGSLTWWVQGDSATNAAIATPSVTVTPHEPGAYQIGVMQSGETEIVAWEGAIEVRAPGGSEWVNAGQKMVARGSPADPQFRIVSAISKWKQAARVIAGAMPFVNVAADRMSSSGDGQERRAPKTVAPGHSTPAPGTSAATPPAHRAPGTGTSPPVRSSSGPAAHQTPAAVSHTSSAPTAHSAPATVSTSHGK
jgi:hypothetical protein